jgi:processive 1,2-diacylglycerol beta-glucosyltransferase
LGRNRFLKVNNKRGLSFLTKINIIYTDAGAGHRRAAEALYKAAEEIFSEAEISLFNVLDYTTPVFKKSYPAIYLFMINRCPWLFGLGYYLTDIRVVDRIVRYFRRITNSIHCKEFEKYILTEKPDLIITTHWLANEIITSLKKSGKFKSFLATCITDYYPHAFWRNSGVDLYIAPNEDLIPRLVKLGVSREKAHTIGLPISPEFTCRHDKKEIRKQLGMDAGLFSLLITSGGFGVGPIKELVAEIEKIDHPLQVLVVCGNNSLLYEELTAYTKKSRHTIRIFGFVNNMDELMEASDILISKSGGLTSTEAMAKDLPLIILYPIPGQEFSNSEFLVKHGAGLRVKSAKQARGALEGLLAEPERLSVLRDNIGKLAKPNAAREIISYLKQVYRKGA